VGEIINGLDVEKLRELLKEAERNPDLVSKLNRWSARVAWLGEGFSLKSYVRNHSFLISEPSELGGPDTSPNPVEYILSALGACYAIGFIFNATKRGVRIRNLEVSLEGEIDNILVFLGLSSQGSPGYKRIVAKAYVDAEANETTIREIWEETVRTSPVGLTLSKPVEVVAEVKVVG
jgi:uncharacterized OsmC-like protein